MPIHAGAHKKTQEVKEAGHGNSFLQQERSENAGGGQEDGRGPGNAKGQMIPFPEKQNGKEDVQGHFHAEGVVETLSIGNADELLQHGDVDEKVPDQVGDKVGIKDVGCSGKIKNDQKQKTQPVERVKTEKTIDPESLYGIAALEAKGDHETAGEKEGGDAKFAEIKGIVHKHMEAWP